MFDVHRFGLSTTKGSRIQLTIVVIGACPEKVARLSILTGFNSLNLRCILIGQIIRDLDALQGNTEKPSNPHSIPSHR
jgi:hypothetical protein